MDGQMEEQIKILKEEVKNMLVLSIKKPLSEQINLIDSIHRLGLKYHFEVEIDDLLQHIHNSYVQDGIITTLEQNLQTLALLFRLLRQEGYYISPGNTYYLCYRP